MTPCTSRSKQLRALSVSIACLVAACRPQGVSTTSVPTVVATTPEETSRDVVAPEAPPPQEPPAACTQPLTFADATVARTVRSLAGRGEDEPVRPSDGAGVDRLDLHGSGPISLAGVECLSGLRRLAVVWREFEEFEDRRGRHVRHLFTGGDHLDLAPIATLTTLEELHVVGAQVTDVAPIAGLVRLRVLELTRTSHPAPSFAGMAHGPSEIRDLGRLARLRELVELHVRFGQVASVDGVASLPALRVLDLGHNELTDIAPLASLNQLTTLDLSYNGIVDLSPLRSMTSLRQLDVSRNAVNDLTPLLSIPSLVRVDISSTGRDCADLSAFAARLRAQHVHVETSCP